MKRCRVQVFDDEVSSLQNNDVNFKDASKYKTRDMFLTSSDGVAGLEGYDFTIRSVDNVNGVVLKYVEGFGAGSTVSAVPHMTQKSLTDTLEKPSGIDDPVVGPSVTTAQNYRVLWRDKIWGHASAHTIARAATLGVPAPVDGQRYEAPGLVMVDFNQTTTHKQFLAAIQNQVDTFNQTPESLYFTYDLKSLTRNKIIISMVSHVNMNFADYEPAMQVHGLGYHRENPGPTTSIPPDFFFTRTGWVKALFTMADPTPTLGSLNLSSTKWVRTATGPSVAPFEVGYYIVESDEPAHDRYLLSPGPHYFSYVLNPGNGTGNLNGDLNITGGTKTEIATQIENDINGLAQSPIYFSASVVVDKDTSDRMSIIIQPTVYNNNVAPNIGTMSFTFRTTSQELAGFLGLQKDTDYSASVVDKEYTSAGYHAHTLQWNEPLQPSPRSLYRISQDVYNTMLPCGIQCLVTLNKNTKMIRGYSGKGNEYTFFIQGKESADGKLIKYDAKNPCIYPEILEIVQNRQGDNVSARNVSAVNITIKDENGRDITRTGKWSLNIVFVSRFE